MDIEALKAEIRRELARSGGKSKSPRKQASSRANLIKANLAKAAKKNGKLLPC